MAPCWHGRPADRAGAAGTPAHHFVAAGGCRRASRRQPGRRVARGGRAHRGDAARAPGRDRPSPRRGACRHDPVARWRAPQAPRRGACALAGRVTEMLEGVGWEVRPEVAFSIWGERGSIDLLGWHERTATVLVIEVKTELTSVEETLRRHDAKARLAAGVAQDQLGWQPRTVARLLVLPNAATLRRRVHRHGMVLGRAYAARGGNVRGWLRDPSGGMSGLMFVSVTHGTRGRRSPIARRRVRKSGSSATPPSHGAPAGPEGIYHASGA